MGGHHRDVWTMCPKCQGRPLRPATRGRSKHLLGSKGLHRVIVLQFLSCPEIWIRDNAKKHRIPRGFRCTLYIRCEMSENRWLSLIIKEEEGQWYLFPVSSHGWVSPSWCALVWLCFCTWVASSPSQAGVSMNAVFISWTDHKKKDTAMIELSNHTMTNEGNLPAFRFNEGNNEPWGFVDRPCSFLTGSGFWSVRSRLTTSGWSGMVESTREEDK